MLSSGSEDELMPCQQGSRFQRTLEQCSERGRARKSARENQKERGRGRGVSQVETARAPLNQLIAAAVKSERLLKQMALASRRVWRRARATIECKITELAGVAGVA